MDLLWEASWQKDYKAAPGEINQRGCAASASGV